MIGGITFIRPAGFASPSRCVAGFASRCAAGFASRCAAGFASLSRCHESLAAPLVRVSVLRASLAGVLRASQVRVSVLRASLVGVLLALIA